MKSELLEHINSLIKEGDDNPNRTQAVRVVISHGGEGLLPKDFRDIVDRVLGDTDCSPCYVSDIDVIEKRAIKNHQIKQRFNRHKNGKMNHIYKLCKNRNK